MKFFQAERKKIEKYFIQKKRDNIYNTLLNYFIIS